jgi:hypothetical protein
MNVYEKDAEFKKKFTFYLREIFEKNPMKRFHYVYSNAIPHYRMIGMNARNFIKSRIQPTDELQKKLETRFQDYGIYPKRFHVIHLRSGDLFLVQGINPSERDIQRILGNIFIHIEKKLINIPPQAPVILLSDCNRIKVYCKKKFPRLRIHLNPMSHLGNAHNSTSEAIENSLIDFYTMSHARTIFCITPYNWGSGFSEYCAILYQVPYQRIIYSKEVPVQMSIGI